MSYIAYLDVTGNWTKFNLSGNVFKVENGNLVSFYSKIKVKWDVFFEWGIRVSGSFSVLHKVLIIYSSCLLAIGV